MSRATAAALPDDALPADGRIRVVVETVQPSVDTGRFPIKRTLGELVTVEADVFADGHDLVACALRYRHESDSHWQETRMGALGNDRWQGAFRVQRLGRYYYQVQGWIDAFGSWRAGLARRPEDDPDLPVALGVGARLIEAAAARAAGADIALLQQALAVLRSEAPVSQQRQTALEEPLALLMERLDARDHAAASAPLAARVDRERARCGAWYEFFPRSAAAGRHARLSECGPVLDYVADMGFDVVYLPPIHPIGRSFRKGPNNVLTAAPGDVGSPWAIGGPEGGHADVHPQLGGLEEFAGFIQAARSRGLEVALDLAFQCSPDHPYVHEHPQWFRHRSDGSIQYAENPPKKYQDIYPLDFESDEWPQLWRELLAVTRLWIDRGVHIFRVDNPHTKPFGFWEWLIGSVQREHPDVLFLSEAFTRPKVMRRLAKLGFTQSYTYFTWRNTKQELTEYLTELVRSPQHEYLRPNLWPNTPDILHEYLQFGGRAAFIVRLTLAATLAASYGIYGPAFELLESEAREHGSEEYARSEKYQLRSWDRERPESLREYIALVNRIRREHAALQFNDSLEFHQVDNDQLICYSKHEPAGTELLLMVVNLDPHYRQSGWVELPLEHFGIGAGQPYQLHDLLSGAHYLWHGARNYVELDPQGQPAHIFLVQRRVHREQDFDYYM